MTTQAGLVTQEFDSPPPDPVALFRDWFDRAAEHGVREPGALSLATADARGRVSNRVVQVVEVTATGLVFTSHAGSRKGREIAATGWASGVLYWRETKQQVVLTGPARRLPDARADALWAGRPPETHPMSVASHQSEPLEDEDDLRTRARRLADSGDPLGRPASWAGYELSPDSVEFWQGSPDRLHRRLRYERAGAVWTYRRLQP